MTFRKRLTLVAAAAVAIAVAIAAAAAWFLVRHELRAQVDRELGERAVALARVVTVTSPDGGDTTIELPGGPGDTPILGAVELPNGDRMIVGAAPPGGLFRSAAPSPGLHDLTLGGVHYRALSVELPDGGLAVLSRPLTEVDDALTRLAFLLALLAAAGVAIAVALGLGVTKAAASPVGRLTEAAEHVTATGDLSLRIEESPSRDEVGRLASSFNAMLAALETSVSAQRQLVADASHELRTPLTSIRTNVDLLSSRDDLEPAERERVIADVSQQLEELSTLVTDVVELARGVEQPLALEALRLDEVVTHAVERARSLRADASFVVEAEPSIVNADRSRLHRAVANVLDNAATWGGDAGPVEVTVRDHAVEVRDHGPGFADDDLPHVFDRFYRAAPARGAPGSGLGLAIVRQVAEAHGGSVSAANAPGGGAIVRLELSGASQPLITRDSPARDPLSS